MRLRLMKGEVAEFAKTGFIEDAIQIGARIEDRMIYRLELSKSAGALTAMIEGTTITVQVPSDMGTRWAQGNEVGLYAETGWGLKLAIEKDFKCLQPRAEEDDSDAFEHPTGVSGARCREDER